MSKKNKSISQKSEIIDLCENFADDMQIMINRWNNLPERTIHITEKEAIMLRDAVKEYRQQLLGHKLAD